MSQPPLIETDNLILRPHQASDHSDAAMMWNDPEVVRHIGGATRSAQDVWFAMTRVRGMWPMMGYGYWVVTDRETGTFLGEAGFADFKRGIEPDISALPEAGWAFAQHAWGRGVATEAVRAIHDWLDAELRQPSVCIIDEGNLASQKVAGKFGYTFWCTSSLRGAPINLFRREAF